MRGFVVPGALLSLVLAVPLFIVAANIMNAGTISDRLLTFCVALVGRFRGGLGHVNVVASLIFSGMSGSAVADAAGIGKIIIEMMTKSGHYTRGYAAAITAAAPMIKRFRTAGFIIGGSYQNPDLDSDPDRVTGFVSNSFRDRNRKQ